MRAELDAEKLRKLMQELARATRGPGCVYLTGGTTAVLEGWRTSTVDADLKFDPEPEGIFEAIQRAKDALDVNIELASPDLFIPELPGWRERSVFISQLGAVSYYHYDFYAQALAKIERGADRDLRDVGEMVRRGRVDLRELPKHFEAIRHKIVRYPALDETAFEQKLDRFLRQARGPHD